MHNGCSCSCWPSPASTTPSCRPDVFIQRSSETWLCSSILLATAKVYMLPVYPGMRSCNHMRKDQCGQCVCKAAVRRTFTRGSGPRSCVELSISARLKTPRSSSSEVAGWRDAMMAQWAATRANRCTLTRRHTHAA